MTIETKIEICFWKVVSEQEKSKPENRKYFPYYTNCIRCKGYAKGCGDYIPKSDVSQKKQDFFDSQQKNPKFSVQGMEENTTEEETSCYSRVPYKSGEFTAHQPNPPTADIPYHLTISETKFMCCFGER